MDNHPSRESAIGLDPDVPPALAFMGYLDSRISGDEEWRQVQATNLHRSVLVVGALMLCVELARRTTNPTLFLVRVAAVEVTGGAGARVEEVGAVLLHTVASEFSRHEEACGTVTMGFHFDADPYTDAELLEGLSNVLERVMLGCLRLQGVDVTNKTARALGRARLMNHLRSELMS